MSFNFQIDFLSNITLLLSQKKGMWMEKPKSQKTPKQKARDLALFAPILHNPFNSLSSNSNSNSKILNFFFFMPSSNPAIFSSLDIAFPLEKERKKLGSPPHNLAFIH